MKAELIDFLIWFKNEPLIIKNTLDPSNVVDLYLKSINSEASSKTPSVSKNKQAKKVFCDCKFVLIMRDQNTQIAYCSECKLPVKEN